MTVEKDISASGFMDVANLVPGVYSAIMMAAGRGEDPGIHWRNTPRIANGGVFCHVTQDRNSVSLYLTNGSTIKYDI